MRKPFEVTTLREDTEDPSAARPRFRVSAATGVGDAASARLHHQCACRAGADGVVHDYVRAGLDDIAFAPACASSAAPSKRIAEDYLRILRFFSACTRHFGTGEVDRAGYLACIAGRGRPCDALGRTAADGDAQSCWSPMAPWGAVTAMADGGLLLPIFRAASPIPGPFATMITAERLLELKPDPIRRLRPRSAVAVTEDAQGGVAGRLRLSNGRDQGTGLDGASLVAGSRERTRAAGAAAALSAWRRQLSQSPDVGLGRGVGGDGGREAYRCQGLPMPRLPMPRLPITKTWLDLATLAAALECAEISVEGRRIFIARRGLPKARPSVMS